MSLEGAGQGILHGICKPLVLSSASILDHSVTFEFTFNSALCSQDIASSATIYTCQGHSVCHSGIATVELAGCVSSRKHSRRNHGAFYNAAHYMQALCRTAARADERGLAPGDILAVPRSSMSVASIGIHTTTRSAPKLFAQPCHDLEAPPVAYRFHVTLHTPKSRQSADDVGCLYFWPRLRLRSRGCSCSS